MTQTQREALLDLLTLSVFIDSYLSLSEDHALQSALESLGWESPRPKEIFVLNSMSRARTAAESDANTDAFIKARAAAFTDTASQSAAVTCLQKVLSADGIAQSESDFLARVQAAFPTATA